MSVERFANLLRDSIGLDGGSIGAGAIERAVRERAAACGADLDTYWARLIDDRDERQALIEAVVVPETWFFRDRGAFRALARLVQELPERLQADRPVRVLSVPCSTGEEAYSIAMTLLDAGLSPARFVVEGVDVSLRALAAAQTAVYRKNSFRDADLGFRARYFEQHDGCYALAAAVRQRVSFRQGNLLDSDVASEAAYDAVFCRNLLIYFDPASRDRAVAHLLRMLTPSGTLFVGPSETGLMLNHRLVPVPSSASFAFHKPPACSGPGGRGHAGSVVPRAKPPVVRLSPSAPQAGRFTAHGSPSMPRAPYETGARSPREPAPFVRPLETALPAGGAASSLDEIEHLADRGAIDEAKRQCAALLEQDVLNTRASYLMGLLEDASGNVQAAVEHYRRVLYLQPEHHEALVHLAAILDCRGEKAAASRLYARARRARGGDGT